jgi:hypothetical protein
MVKGWFNDTVFTAPVDRIALLRLDGDLYTSTMDVLHAFYHKVPSLSDIFSAFCVDAYTCFAINMHADINTYIHIERILSIILSNCNSGIPRWLRDHRRLWVVAAVQAGRA